MNSSQNEFPTGINILPIYIQFHLEMIKNSFVLELNDHSKISYIYLG